MRFPFTASDESVSIFLNGRMNTIVASAARFLELIEHLKLADHDPIFIEAIIDRPRAMARLTCGALTVVGSTVFYNGIPAHSALCMKLIAMLDAGFDATPWANFFANLMENPSEESKVALYGFLDKWNVPFTEDGCFIAFKYVRDDYTDGRTGRFDNSPGKTVKMLRIDVDPDPNQTCSYGLHVASSHFLEGYTNQKRIVACKVNPRDVVAIPNDYQHSKMRVCEYVVLCDVENHADGGFAEIEAQEVFISTPLDTAIPVEDDVSDGFDADGFDEGGYDCDGYDEWGFDRAGYDPSGYDDSGFDEGGFNDSGYDMSGYDEDGFDEMDVDNDGFDRDGYDRDAVHRADVKNGITMFSVPDTDTKSVSVPSAGDGAGYVELIFARNNEVFTASMIVAGIAEWGQRGFSEKSGVPRSTLQGWLTTIRSAKL